jgi:hypothetical protein
MYMEDIGDWGIRVDCEHPSTCTIQLLCLDQVLHAAMGPVQKLLRERGPGIEGFSSKGPNTTRPSSGVAVS